MHILDLTPGPFENEILIRRERVFRDRNEELEVMNDLQLIEMYRFPRHTIFEKCCMVENYVSPHTNRSHAIPTHIQVIASVYGNAYTWMYAKVAKINSESSYTMG